MSNVIKVETIVNSDINNVWTKWTTPKHIMEWNNASPDWHTPKAENDLKVGGKFNYLMAAKDKSFEFEFWGIYDKIIDKEYIEYTLGDGRKVKVTFKDNGKNVTIIEEFDPESENSIELQKNGWQAILNNFKKYVELK